MDVVVGSGLGLGLSVMLHLLFLGNKKSPEGPALLIYYF